MFVVYRGDSRFPERIAPYRVPGMTPFPRLEAREITDADVKASFAWESAEDFCEFNFGERGVYNANMPAPRFTVHTEKPEDVPLEGEPSDVQPPTDDTTTPTADTAADAPSQGE